MPEHEAAEDQKQQKTDCETKKEKTMAIRQRLVDDERDDLTKDLDDLDAAYIEQMREDGIDEELLKQLAAMMKKDHNDL